MLIDNILHSLKESHELCDISMESPDDQFYSQIIDFNEFFVLVRRVLPDNGDVDGYSLLFKDLVRNISWEGELISQLKILLDDSDVMKMTKSDDKIRNINIHNDFFKILKRINSLFGHITVYDASDNGEFYFGQIKETDEKYILMKVIGDKSHFDDKNMLLRLEDIGRIDFGGIYDESMLKIYRIKNKLRA